MIRACPRCGDFYADESLLFCPADGTPLADVDPYGEEWDEAARAVEEKERASRRRVRRLKRRRVLMLTTTVLITTLVVCVVAVNTYVYLAPEPDAPVVASALKPTPTPTPRRSETPAPTETPDSPSSLPFVPAVTPTPTLTPTPSPTPTRKATPTDTKTPAEKCTAADRQRLRDDVVAGHAAAWQEAIKGERAAVIKENVPAGSPATGVEVGHGEATLGPVSFDATVSETCASASVTARYEWRVTWEVFSNGRKKTESKAVGRTKTFSCEKSGGAWRCG